MMVVLDFFFHPGCGLLEGNLNTYPEGGASLFGASPGRGSTTEEILKDTAESASASTTENVPEKIEGVHAPRSRSATTEGIVPELVGTAFDFDSAVTAGGAYCVPEPGLHDGFAQVRETHGALGTVGSGVLAHR